MCYYFFHLIHSGDLLHGVSSVPRRLLSGFVLSKVKVLKVSVKPRAHLLYETTPPNITTSFRSCTTNVYNLVDTRFLSRRTSKFSLPFTSTRLLTNLNQEQFLVHDSRYYIVTSLFYLNILTTKLSLFHSEVMDYAA